MSVLNPAARLRKLRAMSAAEIASRVRYKAVLAVERRQHARGRLADSDQLAAALRADLRGRDWPERLLSARASTKGRFLAGAQERAAMQALFASRYARERQDAQARAAAARGHRFAFFGREVRPGPDIDWQADPITGRRWPSRYHADVPVHGGDAGYGDVKYVWELNRQQYLIDLAKAWFLDESGPDLDAMARLVRSWIAGNPYATGVNWACALEPAFRAWSWLWAYHLTAGGLDRDFHLEWLGGFYDHGRFLARHLEHYASPYNHLIGEASALYTLGCCFPEFRASAAWRRLGRRVLEERLGEQFYADGGSVEQSCFYHHATTGFYILAGLVARANGEDLRPAVWTAIERALAFSAHLVQPDGKTPEIGGADDGKPIRMEHLPFWDFRPYLAIGAVLFGRGDFKTLAGRFHEDALWLLGPAGLDAFERLQPAEPAAATALLAASGYAVDRSGWSAHDDYVLFDVGEQAAGMRPDGVPNSMHGHADALSVILWLGGRRVLVDSGLYAYNCGGAWEAHFRETAAHNTARIDGRDQARHIGKMAWSHSYRVTVEDRFADRRQAWTLASHDGYARGPAGVIHRRAVWLRPGGYVLVFDEFVGAGRHDLEVNWQFAPGTLALTGEGSALFDGEIDLAWAADNVWSADVRCGGPDPADGWICPSLGVRTPAPRLTLRAVMEAGSPVSLLTVAAARAGGRSRIARGESGGLVVSAGDATDWIAARRVPGSPAIDTDALLAVWRVAPDGADGMRIGGTYLRADAAALDRQEGRALCTS